MLEALPASEPCGTGLTWEGGGGEGRSQWNSSWGTDGKVGSEFHLRGWGQGLGREGRWVGG